MMTLQFAFPEQMEILTALAAILGLVEMVHVLMTQRLRRKNLHGCRPEKAVLSLGATARHTGEKMEEGLMVGASTTGGKLNQEDAWGMKSLPGCRVVVVADGVSNSSRGDLAAQVAVQVVLQAVETASRQAGRVDLKILEDAFYSAEDRLRRSVSLAEDVPCPPATTLMVVIELDDSFLAGYVGDGAIVATSASLTWMQNLLYPQAGPAGALCSYLGGRGPACRPALLELPKVWPEGGLLLVGTDGALEQGDVLKTAIKVLGEVRALAVKNREGDLAAEAGNLLEEWVDEQMDSDDNRTLGLLVSAEALQTWRRAAGEGVDDGTA